VFGKKEYYDKYRRFGKTCGLHFRVEPNVEIVTGIYLTRGSTRINHRVAAESQGWQAKEVAAIKDCFKERVDGMTGRKLTEAAESEME
jgi:hypothetical protein